MREPLWRQQLWQQVIRVVLLLAVFSPLAAQAGVVLSVGDGDTITVRQSGIRTKVRLACIDAPETAQRPYGQQSRQKLKALIPVGSTVRLREKTKDRYGRTVAEVFQGERNINQSMVGSGNAFVYWQYIGGCDRGSYSRLEKQARGMRLGVWSVSGGVQRPWDFRRNRRTGSSSNSSQGTTRTRWRCKDIGSWTKAQQLLSQGHTYLDRDKDGEACEGLR